MLIVKEIINGASLLNEMEARLVGICKTDSNVNNRGWTWDKLPFSFIGHDLPIRPNLDKPAEKGKGNKGDFVLCQYADKLTIYLKCPQCGSCSFSGTHNVVNNNGIVTVTPSIDMECCSWHGYLKQNVLTKA